MSTAHEKEPLLNDQLDMIRVEIAGGLYTFYAVESIRLNLLAPLNPQECTTDAGDDELVSFRVKQRDHALASVNPCESHSLFLHFCQTGRPRRCLD
jgi:hypothetical protein